MAHAVRRRSVPLVSGVVFPNLGEIFTKLADGIIYVHMPDSRPHFIGIREINCLLL